MGRLFKSSFIVLGMMLPAVANAQAGLSHAGARACLAVMRRFDVFNEQRTGAPAADPPSASADPPPYLPKLERIQRAAGQGNIRAEAALGDMYLEGRCGLEKDMDKALELGARAGGYFDIAMMYMGQKKPGEAYKWFTIGLLKDPWYTAREVRLTLQQAGITAPSKARVQDYLDRVTMSKQVIRRRLQLLKTTANMSDEQVATAKRQARAWLKAHP